MDTTVDLFRHNAWATQTLLDFCASLPAATMQESRPGTYGSIIATLRHLSGAEERYLTLLEGSPRRPEVMEPAGLDIAALQKEAAGRAERWLALLAGDIDPASIRTQVRADGTVVTARTRTVLVQAVHHGNDHRTHVCTILGALGMEAPALDAWTFYSED